MGGPMVDLERHMISFVNLQVAMHKVALAVVLIDSTSEIDIANRICLKKKPKSISQLKVTPGIVLENVAFIFRHPLRHDLRHPSRFSPPLPPFNSYIAKRDYNITQFYSMYDSSTF